MSELDASYDDKGITKLDIDPVPLTEPRAVGVNSPRLAKVLSEDYGNSLSTAIDEIDAVSTTLIIKEDTDVDEEIVVPANIYLVQQNAAIISKSSSGSIEFEGIGIIDPLSVIPFFEGFDAGDITFTGDNYPREISTELFDTGNNSATDRIAISDAALIGKSAKINLYPRTITGTVVISEHHHLYFEQGTHENELNTWGITYHPAFLVKSNTRVSGSNLAFIKESPNDGSNYLIGAYHMRYDGGESSGMQENMIVEHLNIIGSKEQNDISGGNAIIHLGNAHNSVIRFCTFHRAHGYATHMGGFGVEGNYAYNSSIHNNLYVSMGSQLANFTNAKNCRIFRNHFDQTLSNNVNTYTLIDLEPNSSDETLENIWVEDNTMDFTGEVAFVSLSPKTFSSASDVNITTNTITVTAHGWSTGYPVIYEEGSSAVGGLTTLTIYYLIVVDVNNIRLALNTEDALAGTGIDLTTTGTGTQTLRPHQKYAFGIAAQGAGISSAKGIFIRRNTILGRPITETSYWAPLVFGILAYGVKELVMEDNYVRGAASRVYEIRNCRYAQFKNNDAILSGDAASNSSALYVLGTAESTIAGNHFHIGYTPQGHATGIYEAELETTVTSSGSTVTNADGGYGGKHRFYDLWVGLVFALNAADYTVVTIDTINQTLTTSAAVGTLAVKSVASSTDVNTGTDTITSTSHNFNNGCRLKYTAPAPPLYTGIGGLTSGATYFVVNKTTNTFQLALATGGDAIDLTSAGTGTQTFTPVLITKFSSNTYRDNKATDGIILESTGTSLIYGDFTRVVSDSITPAVITSNQNNYNPGRNAYRLDLSTNASRNITGLTFTSPVSANGEKHVIYNVGNFDIVLKNDDSGSAERNRFKNSTNADITLTAGQAADLEFIGGKLDRWAVFKRN